MTRAVPLTAYPRASRRGNPIELTILGVGWLSIAATLGYAALATPIVGRLVLSGPIASSGSAMWLLAAAMVATVPVSLATAGLARLLAAFQLALEPRTDLLRRATGGHVPAVPHSFPDGWAIPEVAVGRFGALASLSTPESDEMPGGGPWEVDVEGEWTPVRESQSGQGRPAGMRLVRPGVDEAVFGVKVYAAVVTAAWEIDSRSSCAVLRADEILPYLTGGTSDQAAANFGSSRA
jgi:hypothetical protein